MTVASIALLGIAGLVAGSLNAVAGGGSLVSFPALLATGLGGVSANVTNTVALWPGYVGGALGYRHELSTDRRTVVPLGLTSLVGAAGGCILLLTTSAAVFSALVPWLVLGGTALFAIQPLLTARLRATTERRAAAGGGPGPLAHAGVLLASVYGAYFGAGLGIMLLAVLGSLLPLDLQRVNGIKNALSTTINTVAMLAFAVLGPVYWPAVLVMASASLLGGVAGARVAKRLPARGLRGFVVAFGVVVGVALLLR